METLGEAEEGSSISPVPPEPLPSIFVPNRSQIETILFVAGRKGEKRVHWEETLLGLRFLFHVLTRPLPSRLRLMRASLSFNYRLSGSRLKCLQVCTSDGSKHPAWLGT